MPAAFDGTFQVKDTKFMSRGALDRDPRRTGSACWRSLTLLRGPRPYDSRQICLPELWLRDHNKHPI